MQRASGVMRRILRSLVFKKRSSAGKSDRQAWQASDLLFISAYGEEEDRAITFAHFVEDENLAGTATSVVVFDATGRVLSKQPTMVGGDQ